MKASTLVRAVGLAVALTGCGGDEGAGETEAGQDTMAAAAPAATDTGGAAMGQSDVVVSMQPVGGSGLSGNATLSAAGAQTRVVVEIRGSQAGAVHQGHIHAGTCEALGAPHAPLTPVTVDAQGNGTSETTVEMGVMDITGEPHAVSFHQANGSPGPPVVCGNVTTAPA